MNKILELILAIVVSLLVGGCFVFACMQAYLAVELGQ